jgi:acetylglutamate kinase
LLIGYGRFCAYDEKRVATGKVDACIEALRGGVKKAHIIDGRVEHSMLLEILTSQGIGTCIEL